MLPIQPWVRAGSGSHTAQDGATADVTYAVTGHRWIQALVDGRHRPPTGATVSLQGTQQVHLQIRGAARRGDRSLVGS
ncbi:hypothetical protein [Geodermatophilus sp. SYSU D00696]